MDPIVFRLQNRQRANLPLLLLILFVVGGGCAAWLGSDLKPIIAVCVPFSVLMTVLALLALTHSVDVFPARLEKRLLFRTIRLDLSGIREIFFDDSSRQSATFKGSHSQISMRLAASHTPAAMGYVVERTAPALLGWMIKTIDSGGTLALGTLKCTLSGLRSSSSMSSVGWSEIVEVEPRPFGSVLVKASSPEKSFGLGNGVPN